MSPTWGTHGCVTLPNPLHRLILFPKPLHNPYYLIAPLSIKMSPRDPRIPTLCLRPLDQSILLWVPPMTQRLKNKIIPTISPQKLAYLHKRVAKPASKRSRGKDEHKSVSNQPPETILDLLAQNAAYQPLNDNANTHAPGDDVIFVKASHSPIDNILCNSAQSSSLLISNREIINGWPSSFSHADCDYFTKLATCYLIKFPSYMCYAVTALRVLTHAPWIDNMFHGHIRELVLCAIGNGWTWADQTATDARKTSKHWRSLRCFC